MLIPLSRVRIAIQSWHLALLLSAPACTLAGDLIPQVASTDAAINGKGAGGKLRTVGAYPYDYRAYSIVATTEGKILLYGMPPVDFGGTASEVMEKRIRAAISGLHNEPMMWNPQYRGWKKVEPPPECKYNRYLHTMTALPGGKLLIAGGLCDGPRMANDVTPFSPHTGLSLWNGSTLKWEAAPELSVARVFHTASLLKDGSVLFAGGENDPGANKPGKRVTAGVESYRNGAMVQLAPLRIARARHTATTLQDGSVMVVGGAGEDGKPLNAVEMWNPAQQAWHEGPSLKTARTMHSATLLADGRLMIAGGIKADGQPLSSVEIWNPTAGAWSDGAPLLYSLQSHAAATLSNGDVLVAGGRSIKDKTMGGAMVWDHVAAQWRAAGFSNDEQEFNAATLLPRLDGTAHVFALKRILQWMPSKSTGSHSVYGKRMLHASTLLPDGRVLMTGGLMTNQENNLSVPTLDAAEIYDPSSRRFAATGRMNQPRFAHTPIALDDGRVVVAGGWVWNPERHGESVANSPEVWDPKDGTWTLIGAIRFAANDHVHVGKLQNGTVLFFASNEADKGTTGAPSDYRAWIWNPATSNVESRTVRAKAHSGAAIAILSDGRVLRVGGSLHSAGADMDPTAEIWDSRTGTVSQLEPPLHWNARDGKTLLLKSGDVLFIDYRPAHITNNRVPPQAEMRLWNRRTEKWRNFPTLATDQNWPMLELRDGSLLTPTHYLPLDAPVWLLAPPQLQINAEVNQLASGQLLALSPMPPHGAVSDGAGQPWHVQSHGGTAPVWHSAPAAVALADGRVMVVATVEATQSAMPTAHIWNPKDDSWADAGRLSHTGGSDSQAILLPSGRVMHIGVDEKNNLKCDLWRPMERTVDQQWDDCSSTIMTGHFWMRPAIGLLDDGRPVLVANSDAVYVFSEQSGRWLSVKSEWNQQQLTVGAPIRTDVPLQRIYDDGKKEWLDISAVAGRFWENVTPHRRYEVQFSDRPTQVHEGVSTPPHLLWNPKEKYWAYVSIQNTMGRHAQFLPDGCAFSWTHFSIFNPATGNATKLTDPGTGIRNKEGSMVVLADSTVVIAGMPDDAGGSDAGFFRRKVSCAGFAALAEDTALMPDVMYAENQGVATVASAPPQTQGWKKLRQVAVESKWIAIAVLGPIAFYLLLRALVMPLARKAGSYVAARTLSKKQADTLQRKLPRSFDRVGRIVLYGALVVIAAPMLLSYLNFRHARKTEACNENVAACVDHKTGILQSVPELEGKDSSPSNKPSIPCRYVGIWSSRQKGGLLYRVTLKDDGTYVMAPNEFAGGNGYKGHWMIQGTNMVWRHTTGTSGEADINPILPESDARFALVEGNGSHTQFELIQAVPSTVCTR